MSPDPVVTRRISAFVLDVFARDDRAELDQVLSELTADELRHLIPVVMADLLAVMSSDHPNNAHPTTV